MKLVSFLIPSINKESFVKSIECLKNTCSNISLVEVLIKIDIETDTPFYEDILQKSGFDHRILCSPVSGYTNIGVFHNEMAAVSQGSLLIPYADDLFMEHGDWVKELEYTRTIYPDNLYAVALLCGQGLYGSHKYEKPWFSVCSGITKEWLQCLGYIAFGYQIDYWIALVARDIGRYIHVPREKCYISFVDTVSHIRGKEVKKLHTKMYKELPNAVKKLKINLL